MMWGYEYGNDMMGYGLFHNFFSVLWLVFIIVVAVAIMRRILGGRSMRWMGSEKTPLDILKERYAKGEINKSEFDEKKKDVM